MSVSTDWQPKAPPPPRLYKYQSFSGYALNNLAENRVYFSRPKDFNDPFEFHVLFDERPLGGDEKAALRVHARKLAEVVGVRFDESAFDAEAVMRDIKDRSARMQEQLRERGVACFSEINDHPLMWAHYAAGHTGFCLEFSTEGAPFSRALKVNYATTAPRIDLAKWVLRDEDDLTEYVRLAAATKLKAWEYEQEWRCLHVEGDKCFSYEARLLTAIYFGLRMKRGHSIVIAATLASAAHTKLYQMVESAGGYGLTAEPTDFKQPMYES